MLVPRDWSLGVAGMSPKTDRNSAIVGISLFAGRQLSTGVMNIGGTVAAKPCDRCALEPVPTARHRITRNIHSEALHR